MPAGAAAMANGMLVHGLDYDDTHADSVCHISAVVVPAAVAAAQANSSSGSELIAALIAGNETVARLGMAAPSEFHHMGFHPTAVCGIFGATVAAARLYGLDLSQTTNALGIAGSMASGIFEYLSDGSSTKRQHPGWAAHGGIYAARLAKEGATGPATVFEGRFGLYQTYLSRDHGERLRSLVAQLGLVWETPSIAFKAYPACHFVHACLDAVREATAEYSLSPPDIERITVSVPDAGIPIVLEPRERKIRPLNGYEAKFSLQFCVAAMLVRGSLDLSTFEPESLHDAELLATAEKIDHVRRDFPTYPDAFPGSVRIATKTQAFEHEVPYQRGGPGNPMTPEEVTSKFRANASYALGEEDVVALTNAVLSIERATDVTDAFEPLCKAAARAISTA